jgi:hypothetical protein
MNFGQALEEMKAGKKVARAGWNGKKMWVALTPATVIKNFETRQGSAAGHLANENINEYGADLKDPLRINAHIDMRAADGTLVVGWLASQTDMVADDWTVIP